MTRGLAQAQQRLEHLDLGLRQAFLGHALEQRRLVVLAQLVVERALLEAELAGARLLGALGQLGRDLGLGAAEQEGAHRLGDERDALAVGGARRGEVLEDRGAAEHPRVEELEERPQLAEVVLDRRPAEREPVLCLEQARGLGGARRLVLDRLRLVEHRVVEVDRRELGDVAAEDPVGGEDEVDVLEMLAGLEAIDAGVIEDAQPRGEARGLALPVEDERARRDDDRRAGSRRVRLLRSALLRRRTALLPACGEEGEHLHRLPQAHVVGEAAAEAEAREEVQPAEPLALVAAQLAVEARGRVLAGDRF